MATRKKGIVIFLMIAFGVAWIPLIIQWGLGLRSLSNQATIQDYVIFTLLTLPTSFAPAVGSLIVRKWVTREGFADAGLRLNIRKAWRYYLFALFYPLIIVPIALILAVITRAERPESSVLKVMPLLQMIVLALVSTPVAWGEEFGWRGFLQVRLFADRPIFAAMVTGIIWSIWHYPMILLGFLFFGNPLGLLLYPVNMIFTSLIYGWLRLRSGSIWTASLAHATGNTIINPMLQSLLPTVPWPLLWAGYRLVGLAALCVWIILKGQLSRKHELSYA